jgi:hypothetical protein
MTTVSWDEVKRRAEQVRVAAGHSACTEADRAAGQRRLDDEIHAYRLAEVRWNRVLTQREVAEVMEGVRPAGLRGGVAFLCRSPWRAAAGHRRVRRRQSYVVSWSRVSVRPAKLRTTPPPALVGQTAEGNPFSETTMATPFWHRRVATGVAANETKMRPK